MTPAGLSFVALVPARLASTRLPDKPLADIAGLPMVVRVAGQARASGARHVAIATDSARIADVARSHGIAVVMTRDDHPSGTDRLAEAAAALGLADDEIVVNVQGDEPLLPPTLIAEVATTLSQAPDCAIATAAHPIDVLEDYLSPNVVKVALDARRRALYFSRAPIPFDRDGLAGLGLAGGAPGAPDGVQESGSPGGTTGHGHGATLPPALRVAGLPLRHIGLYAYRASFLRRYPQLARAPMEALESLEQLRALWHGFPIAVAITEAAPPPGVDTPADLERVRRVLGSGGAAA